MLLGAVSLVAAITNGLRFINVEVPALTSPALRWVLAIVGLALVVVGFVVFGRPVEGGTPLPGPTTSQPAPPSPRPESTGPVTAPETTPSAQAYARQAASYCAASASQINALVQPTTDDERINYTFDLAAVLEQLATNLDTLTRDAPDPGKHSQLVFRIGNTADSLNSAATALRTGDKIGYDQGWDNADQYRADFNRVAVQLALHSCQVK
ncbi:hypothetical protein [Kribbella speibonae]|uniref:Uncharacterized protein n=1 Tax=Kribbella speibonae TaxID=1572660 RepID=A0A4R0IKM7_9ACTN|nr:hypothetical protein [Kribbella speibonae]TCC32840.1 hypothetical protein E0H92_32215 [Kribbella speibonae]